MIKKRNQLNRLEREIERGSKEQNETEQKGTGRNLIEGSSKGQNETEWQEREGSH